MATSKFRSSKSRVANQALLSGLRKIKSQLPIAGLSGDPRKWSKRKQLNIYKKYRPIAEGKAQVVKLSPAMARQYEDANLKAVQIMGGNRAVVPVEPGYSKVQLEKGEPLLSGMVKQTKKLASGEIDRIILPYRLDKITAFIEQAKKHPDWNKLKKDAEKFRFGFGDGSIDGTNWNGNRWGSLADIAEYLQGYQSVKEVQDRRNSRRDKSLMSALQIVRVRSNSDIDQRVADQKTEKRDKQRAKQKAKYDKLRKQRGK